MSKNILLLLLVIVCTLTIYTITISSHPSPTTYTRAVTSKYNKGDWVMIVPDSSGCTDVAKIVLQKQDQLVSLYMVFQLCKMPNHMIFRKKIISEDEIINKLDPKWQEFLNRIEVDLLTHQTMVTVFLISYDVCGVIYLAIRGTTMFVHGVALLEGGYIND